MTLTIVNILMMPLNSCSVLKFITIFFLLKMVYVRFMVRLQEYRKELDCVTAYILAYLTSLYYSIYGEIKIDFSHAQMDVYYIKWYK